LVLIIIIEMVCEPFTYTLLCWDSQSECRSNLKIISFLREGVRKYIRVRAVRQKLRERERERERVE